MHQTQNMSGVNKLLFEAISVCGFEFVGCEIIRQPKNTLLRVYIDSPAGITLDDCEKCSHQISNQPEIDNFFPGSYTLEVSSPGLDRPLFNKEQFKRFVGHKVQLKLYQALENQKNFKGILLEVLENQILLVDQNQKQHSLDFDNIEKARLVPEI